MVLLFVLVASAYYNISRQGSELMDIGYRIKYIRNLKGLTQKELGIAVGFDEKAADIRIAQYESGSRIPRENIVKKIADVLGVIPKALTVPEIKSVDDIIQMLFAFEDECRLKSLFEKDEMLNFFSAWNEKRQDVLEGRISKEEYDLWRFNYSG